MAEKLAIVQNAASALFGKDKGTANASSPTSSGAESGSAAESSKGNRGLRRIPVSNQTATETTPETTDTAPAAPADSTQTVQPYQTLSELMASLLAKVSMNLAISQNDAANILNLTAQQGQAASNAAISNQVDLNQQLEEQQRRSKRMKIIGWAVRGIVIGIAITSTVASGGLAAAPAATLLMLSLTTLTVVKPDLLNNKVISPLSNLLVKAGMPEPWANFLATVIVVTVLVAATAGAGAGDSRLVAKEGADYLKLIVGNAGMVEALLIGSTNPFGKLVEAFPNAPKWAEMLGTMTSVLIAIAAGVTAGGMLSSAGGSLTTGAKMALGGMGAAEGGARVELGRETIEQGKSLNESAVTRSNILLDQAAINNANTFSQSTKDLMEMITQSFKSVAEATRSLTAPAAAAIASAPSSSAA